MLRRRLGNAGRAAWGLPLHLVVIYIVAFILVADNVRMHRETRKGLLALDAKHAKHGHEELGHASAREWLRGNRQQRNKDGDNDGLVHVNDYFDRVFYVNNDEETEKRDRMRAMFSKFAIEAERFSAVDQDDPDVVRDYIKYMRQQPANEQRRAGAAKKAFQDRAEFAFLRTAAGIIRESKQRAYRRILLLSDEVRFHRDFSAEFDRKVRLLPENWRLLYLGAIQRQWGEGALTWDQSRSREFYHPLVTDGAFAVGIDSSVFDILLFEISKDFNTFALGALNAVAVPYHNESFVFYPNLVIAGVNNSVDVTVVTRESTRARALGWNPAMYTLMPPPMPLPKVCIVMTLKDADDTLEYSIKSLLRQTYSNLEIVAVDDLSADMSVQVLERLAAADKRIVIVRNEFNRGTYLSRNVGLMSCTGEVYMNHDADDIAVPNRIEVQIQPIIDNRADITISNFIRSHIGLDDLRHEPAEVLRRAQLARVHKHPDGEWMYCCREKVGLMTTMVRMTVFNEIGKFDSTRFSGDAEFIERYMARVMKIFLSEGSFNVHSFLGQLTTWRPYIERINSTLIVAADLKTSLSRVVPIKGDERNAYEARYRQRLVAQANSRPRGV